jgi:hypothetical protein
MEFHNFIKSIEGPKYQITGAQNDLIKFIHSNNHLIIRKKRRGGVSTAVCFYLLWLLVKTPNIRIGLITQHQHEREVFRQLINMSLSKLEDIFQEQFGNGIDVRFNMLSHNLNRTLFPNNSSIHYFNINNTESLRGFAFDVVHISDIEENIKTDIVDLVMLNLAHIKNSKLIITTTMNNEEFYPFPNIFQEYYYHDLFDGKRIVLFEKTKLSYAN